MSRKDRLKKLKDYPKEGPGGFDNKVDLAYWANRASENSNTWTRAKGGPDTPPKLQDTNAGAK